MPDIHANSAPPNLPFFKKDIRREIRQKDLYFAPPEELYDVIENHHKTLTDGRLNSY
jgi:hypothetical protein